MKNATAGFVIYGAPMDQALFETMKTGIRRGVLKKFTDVYKGDISCELARGNLLHVVVSWKFHITSWKFSVW